MQIIECKCGCVEVDGKLDRPCGNLKHILDGWVELGVLLGEDFTEEFCRKSTQQHLGYARLFRIFDKAQ